MKVCTDSCVFGAYVAQKIADKIINPKRILDIGSGTGLLSLMVAQKASASIDAVEIEENSFLQSNENFIASPWNQQLQVFHADIKKWENPKKYDLIISNPPFFENVLKPESKNKMIAKHSDSLTFRELVDSIRKNLSDEGKFALLLPFFRIECFKELAKENMFYLEEQLLLKQTNSHSPFRGILLFGKTKQSITTYERVIRNDEGGYSDQFNFLMKDYYLNID